MAEVALAVHQRKMTLEEANAWVLRLIEKYENVFSQEGGNPGKPFDQVYDLKTMRPTAEWQALYDQVKTELKGEGLIL